MISSASRNLPAVVLTVAFGLVLAACGRLAGDSVAEAPAPAPRPATTPASEPRSDTGPPVAPSTPPLTAPERPFGGLSVTEVATNADFPVLVTAPAGDDRIFIVGKEGTVWAQPRAGGPETLVLDIRSQVSTGNEQGLLSVAFHPDLAANRRAYLSYTDSNGNTVLSEVTVGTDGGFSDEIILLNVDQPAANHNGGMIDFGPDGYLYLGLGDGGGANDQFGNGQAPATALGSLLRLDVSQPGAVGVPDDNPFVGGGGDARVWAYGLRNPWRFTFDQGNLYVADVGQGSFEEITVVDAGTGGQNFGWPIMEGLHCFSPPSGCSPGGLVQPVVEVAHGDAETCSITGGYVYRGDEIPEIDGAYFYSDYCGGYLRSLSYEGGIVAEHVDWSDQVGPLGRVTSFGRDGFGELYVTSTDGRVVRLVAIR